MICNFYVIHETSKGERSQCSDKKTMVDPTGILS